MYARSRRRFVWPWSRLTRPRRGGGRPSVGAPTLAEAVRSEVDSMAWAAAVAGPPRATPDAGPLP